MSNLKRLGRVIKSWKGKITRDEYYAPDDAFMILTELGMQMSPQTLDYLCASDTIKDEFLEGIYNAEEEAGRIMILDNKTIDPAFDPKVYEEGRKVVFTVLIKGKETIFAEFDLPFEAKNYTEIEIE